ncbi:MAG: tyrosine-type recombinase/integrase [Methylobacter sp.]|nr:tyrosine-type recombinase/integrase [Methylobacter sp.]
MAKVKLTAGRIAGFKCDESKAQAFLWCAEVPGLGVRATPNSSAAGYIFQSKVKGQSMRVTIGKVSMWSIPEAQAEARRLQIIIDTGNDPREVKADKAAAKVAAKTAKAAEAAAQIMQEARESVTAGEAWKAYVADRSASIVDGKPEWGEKHKAQHDYFVQAGGVKRTRGRRPNEPETTRPGVLVPLMNMRLIDLDAKAIATWLEKEAAQAPAAAALAFRHLRAFLTWCAKNDKYKSAIHANACQSDDVKKKVPTPQTKKNDSLRRAQIRPWFESVKKIGNPVTAAYLQCLLLTGARRNELAALRWQDVGFQWKSLTIRDKVEGERTIPLTPYVEYLISTLPRRNEFVFSSPAAASGRLEEPRNPHNKALAAAALPALSLHGLRRSFSSLSEWVEVPAGIVAQIMGHKPSAIAEKHYIQRELDLLHLWHVKIEAWILEQAGIEFVPVPLGLRVVVNQ